MNRDIAPDFDIRIDDAPGGLRIAQANRVYLARKWKLTAQVREILDLALKHDLSCLWQQGHPGGDESHHISFSFSRKSGSWVFVIGGEAGPPAVKRVTFNKRLKEYFRHSGMELGERRRQEYLCTSK